MFQHHVAFCQHAVQWLYACSSVNNFPANPSLPSLPGLDPLRRLRAHSDCPALPASLDNFFHGFFFRAWNYAVIANGVPVKPRVMFTYRFPKSPSVTRLAASPLECRSDIACLPASLLRCSCSSQSVCRASASTTDGFHVSYFHSSTRTGAPLVNLLSPEYVVNRYFGSGFPSARHIEIPAASTNRPTSTKSQPAIPST